MTLLERLLQVRAEDFDGAQRLAALRRRAPSAAPRGNPRGATRGRSCVVERGLDLFGAPIDEQTAAELGTQVEVSPEALQLVAYETLVEPEPGPPPSAPAAQLFG